MSNHLLLVILLMFGAVMAIFSTCYRDNESQTVLLALHILRTLAGQRFESQFPQRVGVAFLLQRLNKWQPFS